MPWSIVPELLGFSMNYRDQNHEVRWRTIWHELNQRRNCKFYHEHWVNNYGNRKKRSYTVLVIPLQMASPTKGLPAQKRKPRRNLILPTSGLWTQQNGGPKWNPKRGKPARGSKTRQAQSVLLWVVSENRESTRSGPLPNVSKVWQKRVNHLVLIWSVFKEQRKWPLVPCSRSLDRNPQTALNFRMIWIQNGLPDIA